MKDLWGNDIPDIEPPKPKSEYQKTKVNNGYRKANSWDVRKCKNCIYKKSHYQNGKYYYKCQLIGDSASEATDIRMSHVCRKHVYTEVK